MQPRAAERNIVVVAVVFLLILIVGVYGYYYSHQGPVINFRIEIEYEMPEGKDIGTSCYIERVCFYGPGEANAVSKCRDNPAVKLEPAANQILEFQRQLGRVDQGQMFNLRLEKSKEGGVDVAKCDGVVITWRFYGNGELLEDDIITLRDYSAGGSAHGFHVRMDESYWEDY